MRQFRVILLMAIAAICLIAEARADILSLDCAAGPDGNVLLNVWVDLDKSTITLRYVGRADVPIQTYPVEINPTIFHWTIIGKGTAIDSSINRTTGVFFQTYNYSAGGSGSTGPYNCEKGATPLPATKF